MFHFGVDYYPDQWPEARWAEDARLMQAAGFNVVRMAEFAWALLEPEAGRYDFDWLDRAIALLAQHGVRTVLGTPTASAPVWLMRRYPDAFRLREDGLRVTYGNRRAHCPTNPDYHEHSRQIVARMAEHYADNPAVIGWQIDNEFGERCYCPNCARAFQDWLRRRHGTLDELNRRWGTAFWSHVYRDWSDVPAPLSTGSSPNPGLALDFYRFTSDAYVAFQQQQVDLLRRHCPKHFIVHNFMGFGYEGLNYFDLARPLDWVAWDNYPRYSLKMEAEVDPSKVALGHDTMRGLKRRNFWVMEQQAGSGGWELIGVPPRPGELRLWAYQGIARGADGIVFFRWRTARFGTEQYWHGLLEHDARLGRRYQEVKRMGAELRQTGESIAGAEVRAPVAMLLSYDSRFAFQIQANHPEFDYTGHFQDVYRALHGRQVAVDVVAPTDDLSSYRLVIAPALHVVPQAVADNLMRFVQAGGVLAVTTRSGVKDEHNAVVELPLPGRLAELFGVQVEEYDSYPPGTSQALEFSLPELAGELAALARVLCDVLELTGAESVARYTRGHYAGRPAISHHRFGRGQAVYIGTVGNAGLYERLAGWLLDLAGVTPAVAAPEGVEMCVRWKGDRKIVFLLNHSREPRTVSLDRGHTYLVGGTGSVQSGAVTIPPLDLAILESGA